MRIAIGIFASVALLSGLYFGLILAAILDQEQFNTGLGVRYLDFLRSMPWYKGHGATYVAVDLMLNWWLGSLIIFVISLCVTYGLLSLASNGKNPSE